MRRGFSFIHHPFNMRYAAHFLTGLLLACCLISQATPTDSVATANVIYIPSFTIGAGDTLEVPIHLDLDADSTYISVQVDVTMPDGLDLVPYQNARYFRATEPNRGNVTITTNLPDSTRRTYQMWALSRTLTPFSPAMGTVAYCTVVADSTWRGPSSIILSNGNMGGPPYGTTNVVLQCLPCRVTSPNDYSPGDVNGDGIVSIADANAVVAIILNGERSVDTATLTCADVNNDGMVNIADANAVIAAIR